MDHKNYLEKFLREFDYPEEAREAYRAVYSAVESSPEHSAEINKAVEMLFEHQQDQEAILAILASVADKVKIPAHTVKFYAFLIATHRLRRELSEKGISEQVIHNSLRDFRYKSDECHMFVGIYGSFSDSWLMGWFKGERLAFGRLQFEITKLKYPTTLSGKEYSEADDVIGVHIPRSPDPFNREAQMEAYKLAYEHFKGSFSDKYIPFTCGSWLLFPYNKEILKPTSNTVVFAENYKILASGPAEVWIRFIFGKLYNGNPDDLPEESSLHRGYKQYIKNGNIPGSGYGIFLFDGENVIKE